ncbi:MAG: polysaccharide deacetylase family protein [Clostridia bacterium]|nr:polysaccharide deacetylase family protein [Clostridia bacterium]
MKKLISIAVVLVTLLCVAFAPSLFQGNVAAEEPGITDENNSLDGSVVTTGPSAHTETEMASAASRIRGVERTGDAFGGYPDPASFEYSYVDPDSTDNESGYTTLPPTGQVYYPTTLMYHCVHDVPYTENTALFVRPSELEEQLKVLKELNIRTLFADEFGPQPVNSVILTFDDGYEDNYTYMFPLIKKYNVKVTVYMIGYKIDKPGYLSTEQIKEMSDSGLVQFGCHTLDHPSLTGLSEQGIREQFEGTNWLVSQITGKEVTTVAYPSGDYNETVMDIAREYYSFAYTTDDDMYVGQDPMMQPRYAILRGMSIAGFRVFVE